ncbi:MAG: hypothetical protein HOE30_05695 [Deltaproteobacteria bacterium]|nr:hypothetical protein [Deltaproteobacteria bacterium]
MQNKFHDICDRFSDHDLFLTFSGPMSQNLMVEIGEILKTKMNLEGASFSTILNVFSILVELNQNIIHYSAERVTAQQNEKEQVSTNCSIIAIGREKEHYIILSGNIVDNKDIDRLKPKLEQLNGLSIENLKKLYMEQRKLKPEKGSKGAGLGFIEVARKTSRPLEFDFSDIDDQYSFFSLKTII